MEFSLSEFATTLRVLLSAQPVGTMALITDCATVVHSIAPSHGAERIHYIVGFPPNYDGTYDTDNGVEWEQSAWEPCNIRIVAAWLRNPVYILPIDAFDAE